MQLLPRQQYERATLHVRHSFFLPLHLSPSFLTCLDLLPHTLTSVAQFFP